jgi:hypothetical protein
MENLRSGVATEIADAGGFLARCSSQFFRRDSLRRTGSVFELIVLTIETIKGAGVIKYGQVVVPVLRTSTHGVLWITTAGATGTDKIAYAVCGQGIIVVGEVALMGAATL